MGSETSELILVALFYLTLKQVSTFALIYFYENYRYKIPITQRSDEYIRSILRLKRRRVPK